jgi:hypothetical protein
MLPIMQIVTKNDLIKREASIYLEKMFVKYGIDSRTIVYADLRPLFKDAPGFIIQKFGLDEKLSKEDLKEFRKLCGMAAPAKVVPPPPPPPPPPVPLTVTTTPPAPPAPPAPRVIEKPKVQYPINKSRGTGKSK